MITLIARDLVYFSSGDEDSFFDWLKRITNVVDVRGTGDEVAIDVDDHQLADSDLRELLALFCRYGVEMTQLRRFVTAANAHWFRDDKKMYWHDAVFGP